MAIQLLRWLTLSICTLFYIVYFKGGLTTIKDIQQSVRTTKSLYSTVIIIVITIMVYVILTAQLLICLRYVTAYTSVENWLVVLLGTSMTILSILVICFSRFHFLQNYWKCNVELQTDHKIIGNGPYGIVRHPIYALMLILYAGLGLAFGIWWNWVACTFVVIGYVLLTNYEDKFLAINLSGYPEYQQRTRFRLVPGIW
jgi:protein-S-isoprenylcysteine O-methyltransferase Ste14